MRKSILLFVFSLSTVFLSANDVNKNSDEDIVAKKEAIATNIQKVKNKIIILKIKQSKNLNESIRLLSEIKENISKMGK